MDKNWRPTRSETPWVKELPSDNVKRQMRFCTRRFEGPIDETATEQWLSLSGAEDLLLFASAYPYFDAMNSDALNGMPAACRTAIGAANAQALFGLNSAMEPA